MQGPGEKFILVRKKLEWKKYLRDVNLENRIILK